MQIKANTPEHYIDQLPEDRKKVIQKLRKIILANLPSGFSEVINYGMIGYVIPHTLYPAGYHCDPKMPLPFMSLASQKNYVSIYHYGLYADEELTNWFVDEYAKQAKTKLDMGKSCVRFKKMEHIPYELIGQLCSKISVEKWIDFYETNTKHRK